VEEEPPLPEEFEVIPDFLELSSASQKGGDNHRKKRAELDAKLDTHLTSYEFVPTYLGNTREFLGQLPTPSLQTAFLARHEPLITPHEIHCAREEMKVRQLEKSFQKYLKLPLGITQLQRIFATLPSEYAGSFARVRYFVQQRVYLEQTLGRMKEVYLTTQNVDFLLGEELAIRLKNRLPVLWQLPQGKLKEFRKTIEYEMIPVHSQEGATGPSSDLMMFSQDRSQSAKELLKQFEEDRLYILQEIDLLRILPFTKMSLHSCPRIHMIKRELREYFETYERVRGVTSEMIRYYEALVQKIPLAKRTLLAAQLQTSSLEKSKALLESLPLSRIQLEEGQIPLFIHFIQHMLDNEFLDTEVPPEEDPYDLESISGEMHAYGQIVRNTLKTPENVERFVCEFEEAGSLEEQTALLQQYGLPPYSFPNQRKLFFFFPLILQPPQEPPLHSLSFGERVRELLALQLEQAKRRLDYLFCDKQLIVMFREEGREIWLGAHPISEEQAKEILERATPELKDSSVEEESEFSHEEVKLEPQVQSVYPDETEVKRAADLWNQCTALIDEPEEEWF
jgi:hypothetical protein